MDDPLRKMSYVMHERLAVILEGQEEHLVPIPSIPTFGASTACSVTLPSCIHRFHLRHCRHANPSSLSNASRAL